MSWNLVDTNLWCDPDIPEHQVSLSSIGLYLLIMSWCGHFETDRITESAIQRLGGGRRGLEKLCECGWLERLPDGENARFLLRRSKKDSK